MDVRNVDSAKLAQIQPVKDKQHGTTHQGAEDHGVNGVNRDQSRSRHGFHHGQGGGEDSEFEWLDSTVETSDTSEEDPPDHDAHILDVKV